MRRTFKRIFLQSANLASTAASVAVAEEFDLEVMLEKLSTNNARLGVILQAIERGLTKNPQHIDVAIQHYLQKGAYAAAAKLEETLGRFVDAKMYYEQIKWFNCAAAIAKKTGHNVGERRLQVLELQRL